MTSKESAFQKISSLVERFQEQESYENSSYNETQTRTDFINPFLKAVGWDTDNEEGYAEAYREVIHEDKIKVGDRLKSPDYSFRLGGGKRLFFVEAKKPGISIKDDSEPAYQIRRYGWSAKLSISVITNFKEFAIYDCAKKPSLSDKVSAARIKYITCNDYLKEFDFLWDTFSKEQVLKGSFDKFVKSDAQKKGTTTIDKEFLQSLDTWRKYLATSISWNNKQLDEDEINFAVQQTIDRLIFLRIAEDRHIEPYGNLKQCVKQGNFYHNLFHIFREADQKYNSGLFDFQKDRVSATLSIENKIIKNIINELYYPESPYEFSVLSVEILGNAYEHFLGKIIKIDRAHHASIEEKPEVKKSGGVYYTAQYIVDYIVKATIGEIVKNKTPLEISKIKILDPACGSGSFLLGAYQFLLDWHRGYYTANAKPSKGNKNNPLTPEGNLSSTEKKRILLNNIYGVDLDTNAVEVTKLSLLLKCMEGETGSSIDAQLKLFHEQVLPTLENNIKSGNSLIDVDYYDGILDFGDEKKIKPFNWKRAFPEVFKRTESTINEELKRHNKKILNQAEESEKEAKELIRKLGGQVSEPFLEYGTGGGFDVVIGNPPYVMLQTLETRDVFNYALIKYQSAKYKIDTYQLFTERAIDDLLKTGGMLGFITPNTFLKNIHAEPLRMILLKNTSIDEIVLLNYSVFNTASVDTCILILKNGPPTLDSSVTIKQANEAFNPQISSQIRQAVFLKNNRADFNTSVLESDQALLEKILSESTTLGDFCKAYFGIQTFDRNTYVSEKKIDNRYKPVIDGANIGTYKLKPPIEFVRYIPDAIKSGGNELVYNQERICIRQIGAFPIAVKVPANLLTLNTIYNVYLKDKNAGTLNFFLAIINSAIIRYYWGKVNSDGKKTFPKIKKEAILSIPVPNMNKWSQDNALEEIVKLVEQLLRLNEELQTAKLQSKIEQVETKIAYCENKINEVLCPLYDLSIEDIPSIVN